MSHSPDSYLLHTPSIFVDDSDPAIQYSGTWSAANETDIMSVVFDDRTPMFNTLHVVPILSNGSFSYNFTGVGVSVFATPVDNSTFISQCLLDGIPLTPNPNTENTKFGQSRPVCAAFGLPNNTAHTMSVTVSVPPQDHQGLQTSLSGFGFDYMLVQPESGVSLWESGSDNIFLPILDTAGIETFANATSNIGVYFDVAVDQIASVTRAWQHDSLNGFNTAVSGAQINVTFTGRSLWWYGYTKPDNSGSQDGSSATFAVDGGKASTFGIPANFSASLSQAFLFRTRIMENATHVVTVGYQSQTPNSSHTPLTLQSLIIQRSVQGALVSNSTVGSVPSTTASKLPISPLASRHAYLGGIIGGIGGGVIFLLIVGSGIYSLTRWRRVKRRSMQTWTEDTTPVPLPFPEPTETPAIIIPRKVRASQVDIENPFMQELQAPPITKWTRNSAIPGNSDHPFSSLAPLTQAQGRSGSPINLAPIPVDEFQHPSLEPEAINRRSIARQDNGLQPGTPHLTSLSGAEREREEDSGLRMAFVPILPPAYTIH